MADFLLTAPGVFNLSLLLDDFLGFNCVKTILPVELERFSIIFKFDLNFFNLPG